MRKFRHKEDANAPVIEAVVWAVNGDHPRDACDVYVDDDTKLMHLTEGSVVRRHRHPDIDSEDVCDMCRTPFADHGWIEPGLSHTDDGVRVCPGDIVFNTIGNEDFVSVMPVSEFSRHWELAVDSEHVAASEDTDDDELDDDDDDDCDEDMNILAAAAEIMEIKAEEMTRTHAPYNDGVPPLIADRITNLRAAASSARALVAGSQL